MCVCVVHLHCSAQLSMFNVEKHVCESVCVCVCVSFHLHCSAQLNMFNMEKRYRNKIIIIIIIIESTVPSHECISGSCSPSSNLCV